MRKMAQIVLSFAVGTTTGSTSTPHQKRRRSSIQQQITTERKSNSSNGPRNYASPGVLVRLHSVDKAYPPNCKIVHFIRHAEATSNTCPVGEYKLPQHLDACLTPDGINQWIQFQMKRENRMKLEGLECILTSAMTQTLQTAHYLFQKHDNRSGTEISTDYFPTQEQINDVSVTGKKEEQPPGDLNKRRIVACEHWRETVNYLCDSRRPKRLLQKEFPAVDFSSIVHERDPIWDFYARQYGYSHRSYTSHRESCDLKALETRAREAWISLMCRKEHSLAVVFHRAFMRIIFERMEGRVILYAGNRVKLLLQVPFSNCEIRTIAMESL